jgi:hypothetical protein
VKTDALSTWNPGRRKAQPRKICLCMRGTDTELDRKGPSVSIKL